MQKFNLNTEVLVQITDYGMARLILDKGNDFVRDCIKPNKKVIDGEDWYQLQAYEVARLFGSMLYMASKMPINVNILIP